MNKHTNFKINIINSINNLQNIFENKNFLNNFDFAYTLMQKTIKKGGKILFIGNGGSAADAQHLAAELTGKYLKKRKPLPALALTTDTSVITSISNDENFENIFERQIKAISKKEDLVFAISTSGLSKNIIKALKFCKKRKINNILLTKKNYPKNLKKYCNCILQVPSDRVDRIQEMHIFIGHNLCEMLEKNLT